MIDAETNTEPRFTAAAFLKDKAPALVLIVAVAVVISVILSVLQVSADGIMVANILIALAAIAYFAYDYLHQRTFWSKLEETTCSLDAVEYFTDLIDAPDFLTGKVAYRAARNISSSATDEIAELKTTIRNNREYTELWVHETKTPLAAAKLILDKMHGADATNLKRELERTENLVEQALFSARSNVLTNDYLIREVALADVVRDACKQNMHYLTSAGVSIDIEIDPALKVFADKTWLAFIISQIITNSAKYDATSIRFTADVPENESASSYTLLKMQDNGCGIPAYDVPRVFDRGFTGEVGRAHGSATGMGLYLVARMCAQMGLGVILASEDGVGTRVEISFPHDRRRAMLTEGTEAPHGRILR